MLFTLPFLLLSFFFQFPISDQLPQAAANKTDAVNSTKAGAELPMDMPVVLIHHSIKKGGENGINLVRDIMILLLDLIDTNNDEHMTEKAIDLFVDKMEKNVDTSETQGAKDAIGKAGMKMLKMLLDNLWAYVQPKPEALDCASGMTKPEALEKVKKGMGYFLTFGDTNEDDKLTHGEVDDLFNLLKDQSKLCTPETSAAGYVKASIERGWLCKKKINSECDYIKTVAYPGHPWYCPKLSSSAGKADKTSLMISLDTIKCGLDAFFSPAKKESIGDQDQ